MSEEKQNNLFKKGNEFSDQNTTTTENIEMDPGSSSVFKSNYIYENKATSTEFKEIAPLNTTTSQKIKGTQTANVVELGSECTQAVSDITLATENVEKKTSGKQMLVDRYFNTFEDHLCKRSLSRQSGEEIQSSRKLLRTETSSESSSCERTEDVFKIKNPFEMAELPKVLSDCYTPSISTDSCTYQSSTCSDDASAYSLHGRIAKKPSSPLDCRGTVATGKLSSESSWVNVNAFFYSSITRKIRELYDKLFDFVEFRESSSLDVNAYKHILSIEYITLPISRVLMEDLLDFIDFLTGTEVELREPYSETFTENVWFATSEERKLAFVRENFKIGVQQHECRKLDSFFKECENFIFGEILATVDNPNPEEILNAQYLRFYGFEVKTDEKVDFETESRSSHSSKLSNESDSDFPIERCRLLKLDPNIEQMEWESITDHLEHLNEAIRRSMRRCLSDIRMILDICMEFRLHRNKFRLKSYLSGTKCMLNRLLLLRHDCVVLLGECDDPFEKINVMCILKVKVQIATIFLELLSKLLELNSDCLGIIDI